MRIRSLKFLRFGLGCAALIAHTLVVAATANKDLTLVDPAWIRLAHVDWHSKWDSVVSTQANPGDLAIVSDPENGLRKVLRAKIARYENYTHVANGTPRAELLFHEPAIFIQGTDYLVRWSTYIPRDFEFDSKQMVIISQIHQSAREGGPTVALTLLGTNYYISTRGGLQVQRTTAGANLCCADDDRGKWVNWTLRYIPDDSGRKSLTQLWKNGESVFRSEHIANAYSGDQRAYLKIGLYKAGWKKEQSDSELQTLFYGPVSIFKR
ncbi:heparin lyase I family protein [Paraburkholderia tropica]|uniref:heparin lyase I family protein n=1 Tax=Paraburkholderia tropica TaxID=92647 RepID=UPI002AB1CDB0|nr:heparin lyase I family protein [Paraburkholderia tropica]